MIIWISPQEILKEIEYLRDYEIFIEKFLQEKIEEFNTSVNKRAMGMEGEEKEQFLEWNSEEYFELSEELPTRLRGSIFITTMSLFEFRLNDLCGSLQAFKKEKLSLNDVAGKGIYRAKKYLNKVFEINFPNNPSLWETIDIYQTIRNALVHNEGFVTQDVDKIQKYIEKSKVFSFQLRGSRIILKESFVGEAIDTIQPCLIQLCDDLKNLCDVSKKSH